MSCAAALGASPSGCDILMTDGQDAWRWGGGDLVDQGAELIHLRLIGDDAALAGQVGSETDEAQVAEPSNECCRVDHIVDGEKSDVLPGIVGRITKLVHSTARALRRLLSV